MIISLTSSQVHISALAQLRSPNTLFHRTDGKTNTSSHSRLLVCIIGFIVFLSSTLMWCWPLVVLEIRHYEVPWELCRALFSRCVQTRIGCG